MATFHINIACDVTAGSTSFRVMYRLRGSSIWTSYAIPVPPTSGTTAVISGLTNNLIYEVQIQNINGSTNPLSAIMQDIGITDPDPTLSETSTTLGYSFTGLSTDMTQYTCTIAAAATPGTIITTHILDGTSGTISDVFTGLNPLTAYILSITPVASQFSKTFTYPFITTAATTCPDPSNIVAILISS